MEKLFNSIVIILFVMLFSFGLYSGYEDFISNLIFLWKNIINILNIIIFTYGLVTICINFFKWLEKNGKVRANGFGMLIGYIIGGLFLFLWIAVTKKIFPNF